MIKFNLLGTETATDYSKPLILGGYLASLAVVAGLFLVLRFLASSEIEELTQKKQRLAEELKRLEQKTVEVKEIEKKQKELEARLVRIATLKRSKQGPVKVLDVLNATLPERSWVTAIREKGGVMRIEGLAIDGETVAAFMSGLEKSEDFPKVEIDFSRRTSRQGVNLQEFALKTNVSYGGRIANIAAPAGPPGSEATARPAPSGKSDPALAKAASSSKKDGSPISNLKQGAEVIRTMEKGMTESME